MGIADVVRASVVRFEFVNGIRYRSPEASRFCACLLKACDPIWEGG